MVVLHVKYKNESQFLYKTTVDSCITDVLDELVDIYNGRLKVNWICSEFEDLSKHGVSFPPDMQGLAPEQITELKLCDKWADDHLLENNFVSNPDPIGKRNGKAPVEKYVEVLTKTAAEAKAKVSKKLVVANMSITYTDVKDSLDMLRGALMIVYPMGLPDYDPLSTDFDGSDLLKNSLIGQDALDRPLVDLWWASKILDPNKKLCDFIGKNEKSTLVVKLQLKGRGAPGKEPLLSEDQQKALMLAEFQRREELKKLEEADDDSYLNSTWADNKSLQKSFQGLKDIRFNFR